MRRLLSQDQLAIQEAARTFSREQLLPRYQVREKSETVIDRALMKQMGSLGLIGADLGERYGGLGLGSVTAGVIMEEIGYGDFNVAYVQLLGSLMGSIMEHHARPALAAQWIPRVVAGEVLLGLGLTESQIAAIRALSYETLALRDAGLPHTREAAMCKWMGPKFAYEAIHQCLLTMGHYGWTHDTPHQQRLRDVMGLQIGDGTAQIMKLIIARERVGKVAVQYAPQDARRV